MRQTISVIDDETKSFPNRAIVIGSHCSTKRRKKYLIELLEGIRKREIDAIVIVCSHILPFYEIYGYADYVLYNKNNPLYNREIKNARASRDYWSVIYTKRGENAATFTVAKNFIYHSYAHHLQIYDGINLAKTQNIEYIHYINYDVEPTIVDELDEHYELMLSGHDLVFYDYEDINAGPLTMNTEFFSLKTSTAKNLLSVLSIEDFEKFSGHALEHLYYDFFKDSNKKCIGVRENGFGREHFSTSAESNEDRLIKLDPCIGEILVIPYKYDETLRLCTAGGSNMKNDSQVDVRYDVFDRNFLKTRSINFLISKYSWNEQYFENPDEQYIKVYCDGNQMSFFDIRDPDNLGMGNFV